MTRLPFLARLAAVPALAAAAFAAVLAVGDTVPDAPLHMADGKDVNLSAHSGRTVVLFFYGTWSRKAAADAAKAGALLAGREKQALTVIGVARDAKPEDARKFAEERKLAFPQAADPKAELWARFSDKGLPWTVVMDGECKLRWSAGGVPEAGVEALLTEILGKPDPAPGGTK